MKTVTWLLVGLFLPSALCLLPLPNASAQTNNLTPALQQGLFEEEANRNLDAAVSNYQALVAQFDQDRPMAATAIFRLGECYRKLGQTNDAVIQYQRVVREFGDQTNLASLSRQNLTGLGVGSQPRFQERLQAIIAKSPYDGSGSSAVDATVRAQALEAEASSLKVQIEQLKQLPPVDLRIAIQQNYPNPVLTSLMQQLSQVDVELASLTNDYAPSDLHITRVQSKKDTLDRQIDAQVEGVIEGLKAKTDTDLNTAKALRDQAAAARPALLQIAPTTDDEEQEIRRLQQMIQNSPDLINSPNGPHPLINAANKGWLKVAGFLLDHGADINIADGQRQTALHHAAQAGNKGMAELLLSRGADVNAKDFWGQDPLNLAAGKGFLAVVEVLLANKADVNAVDEQGKTPLHPAALNGQATIVRTLLATGANPNAESQAGRSPLSYAAEGGSPETVKALLAAKADPNAGSMDAPLLIAVNAKNTTVAELLLEHGANPNTYGVVDWPSSPNFFNGRGRATPLYLAVSVNQLPLVKLLLKFKADPNDSQTDSRPLIFSAPQHLDILEALLDAGADPNGPNTAYPGSDPTAGEPLLMTFYHWPDSPERNVAFARLLIAHGASVNVRDNHGNTPLSVAVMQRNLELAKLLLTHNADVNVRNDAGSSPLDLAKNILLSNATSGSRTNASQLADLLRQHGALDHLPNWGCIAVSRPAADFSLTIFRKGTNDWNRFTLLETILNYYESSQNVSIPQGNNMWASYPANSMMPFPDLARLTIVRPRRDSTNETRITVNLLNETNGIDCSKDMPLEFGDEVEIPERDHSLGDNSVGLTEGQRRTLAGYLKGSAQLVVRDQKVRLSLYPYPSSSLIGSVLNSVEAQKVLLSSSDLSRVKVTRRDPKTGKRLEWVINCTPSATARPMVGGTIPLFPARTPNYNGSQSGAAPDLWLRDGDVIEVPEKQN